jgi:hypothetical protein
MAELTGALQLKTMTIKTLNQVREEGMSTLVRSLGQVDAVRFLQQFDVGKGDYTAERVQILGDPSVDEVALKIGQLRRAQ